MVLTVLLLLLDWFVVGLGCGCLGIIMLSLL